MNQRQSLTSKKFQWFVKSDIDRIAKILNEGALSGFLAAPGEPNLGGINVRKLEEQWGKFAKRDFAVTFNSWTSGLEAMVSVLQLPKESEVIVTPWTMSATVACIVNNGLIPKFVDIDKKSFNIDSKRVLDACNSKTSAILAVDIFGKPCDFIELRKIANEKNIYFLIDSAQAPDASSSGRKSAEFADISGYSFNRHKHLQCGEGGIAVTSVSEFADRMRLYRNHSEVASESQTNRVQGHNLRFGEIEASLMLSQLARADLLISHRRNAASKIINGLKQVPGITLPEINENEIHDFYILAIVLHEDLAKFRREIVNELKSTGVPGVLEGYVNAHKLPQFKQYAKESLPIAENMHQKKFIGLYMCGVEWSNELIEGVVMQITKTVKNFS
jgi:perosamine synthetase